MIDRLRQFIDYLNISVRSFESNISASNGLIRKAIANNSDIQSKWITNIVDKYPQLNIYWLLTGKGEMLKSENEQAKTIGFVEEKNDTSINERLLSIIESQQRTIENLTKK